MDLCFEPNAVSCYTVYVPSDSSDSADCPSSSTSSSSSSTSPDSSDSSASQHYKIVARGSVTPLLEKKRMLQACTNYNCYKDFDGFCCCTNVSSCDEYSSSMSHKLNSYDSSNFWISLRQVQLRKRI